MKSYFFKSCLIRAEENQVRVRYRASTEDTIQLKTGPDQRRRNFGPDAAIQVAVAASEGRPGPNPFTLKDDLDYDPFIEFTFTGACTLSKKEIDGSTGLLVESAGGITLGGTVAAMPFSLSDLVEADFIGVFATAEGSDPGPHDPTPPPK